MLPDGQPSVFRRHRRPSDLGCLTLSTLAHHSQTAQSLPCSASAACRLAPEWMGRLVVICRWKYLPSERGGEIEIDGPVAHCLPPPTPLRGMRAFEVDEAWVKLQQKEEDGRSHRLINLRGEITALSEPFGLDEPIFAAELSSATPLPTREGAFAASRHDEGEDGEGRCSSSSPSPLYSTMVLFVGERAARWRSVLRVGEVYVCTHLRQDRLDSQLSGPRLILRSSTDKPARGSHKLTQVWSDSAWQGLSSCCGTRSMCASSPIFNASLAVSLSQQWGDRAAPFPGASPHAATPDQDQSAAQRAPLLVSYEGELTALLHPSVLQLDGKLLLFTTHLPPRHRLGMRVGAQLMITHAHPLCIPSNRSPQLVSGEDQSGECGWELVGAHISLLPCIGLLLSSLMLADPIADGRALHIYASPACYHVIKPMFASGAEGPPSTPWLRRLSSILTLVEMAEVWHHLLAGEAGWIARWEGLISSEAQVEALISLLTSHGLVPIARRPSPHRSPAQTPRQPCAYRRCLYGEFFSHSSECFLAEPRAPVPRCPPLQQIAAELRSLPSLRARMVDVQLAGRCQLILHDDV
ncbi:MAG: hypothetical protein SGPRY_013301, partial [Prymnesium sp.]